MSFFYRVYTAANTLGGVIHLHRIVSNSKLRKLISLFFSPMAFIKLKKLNFLKSNNIYSNNRKLAVVCIIKNEANYIKEWIAYYHLIGIDKFYIYNNDSTDNPFDKIRPFMKDFDIYYSNLSGKIRQYDAYNDALNRARKNDELLLVVDADEFLYFDGNTSRQAKIEMMNYYFNNNDRMAALGINWIIFGSSHYIKKTQGLVTQKYIYRSNFKFKKNKHIKVICDPHKVVGFMNPHYPICLNGYNTYDYLGNKITGPFCVPHSNPKIRINHYFTKSKEEFLEKRNRGMADNLKIRNLEDFSVHDKNDVKDIGMKKYSELIKSVISEHLE